LKKNTKNYPDISNVFYGEFYLFSCDFWEKIDKSFEGWEMKGEKNLGEKPKKARLSGG
jgi:hypothetical protein